MIVKGVGQPRAGTHQETVMNHHQLTTNPYPSDDLKICIFNDAFITHQAGIDMAFTVRRVDYFYTTVKDQPGEADLGRGRQTKR